MGDFNQLEAIFGSHAYVSTFLTAPALLSYSITQCRRIGQPTLPNTLVTTKSYPLRSPHRPLLTWTLVFLTVLYTDERQYHS